MIVLRAIKLAAVSDIIFCYLLESVIEFLPIFSDNGVFQKDIGRDLQFCSVRTTRAAQALAWFVVDYLTCFGVADLDGVEVAAYGFFPGDLAIVISLFDAAFYDAFGVPIAVSAHFALDGWSNPAKFTVILVAAAGFDLFYAGGGEVRFDGFVDFVEPVQFFFFKGGAGVAVFAAAAFAFEEVADEIFFDNFITH